jgi:hypothetical protein
MSADRVDKKWVDVGLAKYSTEAILGTLKHYGVTVDEARFKKAAETQYPMTMATGWAKSWTGVGKFQAFPAAAAGALWERWCPSELRPEEIGAPLMAVMQATLGKPDGEVAGKAFEELEKGLARLPADGARREGFMAEVQIWLDMMHLTFEGAVFELRKAHAEWAKRLAAAADALYPERKELMKAVLDGDAAALTAIARDAARPDLVRLAAVDSLVPMNGGGEVFDVVVDVQKKAVASKDVTVLRALHATTHLIGQHLSPANIEAARKLVGEQHEQLESLTGRAAH